MNDIDVEWTDEDKEDVFFGGIIQAPANSLEEADNLMHKIIQAQKRMHEAEDRAKALHAKVDEWLDTYVKDDQIYINELMAMLVPWAKLEIQDRRTKHIELMDGKVGFRRRQGKTIDSDKAQTVSWYMENWPEYIQEITQHKLDVTNAKQLFRTTGEKAPTIEFEEPRDEPYVEEKK